MKDLDSQKENKKERELIVVYTPFLPMSSIQDLSKKWVLFLRGDTLIDIKLFKNQIVEKKYEVSCPSRKIKKFEIDSKINKKIKIFLPENRLVKKINFHIIIFPAYKEKPPRVIKGVKILKKLNSINGLLIKEMKAIVTIRRL